MPVRTVLVCEAQVPFVTGGAEAHVRSLVEHLRAAGYETDLVSVPFKCYPKDEILAHAAAWRLLDLSESNGRTVDLVIATKFPTYFVRHPNKVAWLVHQHRAAYELCGTEYSDFAHTEPDVGLRDRLHALDREMLGECRRRYASSTITSGRLQRFNGLDAEPLHHPPRLAGRLRHESYGSYLLAVGRLETVKRMDLAVDAMRYTDEPLRLVIAGDGTQGENLRRRVSETGLAQRVELLGQVTDDELVDLYANALAVVYPPYDEDYGYVTLEAFLARKPVVTATDSGGTLAFVEDGVSGLVCEPHAEAVGAAFNVLADRRRAAALGDAGHARAAAVTWDGVVEKLVQG
ncbi:MAG: glycosyltransferase family 4 protein [Acidobacteria bacterium]|nr:glycosyltransferase family 4 protein [Acidobacteriota bacterium]